LWCTFMLSRLSVSLMLAAALINWSYAAVDCVRCGRGGLAIPILHNTMPSFLKPAAQRAINTALA